MAIFGRFYQISRDQYKSETNDTSFESPDMEGKMAILQTRICPLRGHILAPPEGLHVPELPGVNPGGRPQESGDDYKAI